MYLISAMFRTIFFFPSAIRLFSFSRRELLSSPSTIRPSSPTTVTPSTSLFFIFTVMLAPPSPMTGPHGESRSRTRARKPICPEKHTSGDDLRRLHKVPAARGSCLSVPIDWRSEEHTSELQSPCNLVCRLLLE